MSEIKITVDQLGSASVEGHGFSGKSCADATRDYERALGKVTSNTKKPEYFATQKQGQTQKARG